jgi:hypothetical protein
VKASLICCRLHVLNRTQSRNQWAFRPQGLGCRNPLCVGAKMTEILFARSSRARSSLSEQSRAWMEAPLLRTLLGPKQPLLRTLLNPVDTLGFRSVLRSGCLGLRIDLSSGCSSGWVCLDAHGGVTEKQPKWESVGSTVRVRGSPSVCVDALGLPLRQ